MSRTVDVLFARSGCAFILGSLAALIVPVGLAVDTAVDVYPLSPSSTVWACTGGTLGFVIGACVGRRRLTGRPAEMVSGLLSGMMLGGLIACGWAYAEFEMIRSQLQQLEATAEVVAGAENIFIHQGIGTVGLQYGGCLGILAGSAAGWFWNGSPRLRVIASLLPVLTSCLIALGVIEMQRGFRELSDKVLERARRSSAEHELQSPASHDAAL